MTTSIQPYVNSPVPLGANGQSSTADLAAAVERELRRIAAVSSATASSLNSFNVLSYGIVPNSASAAAANTTALKALWDPTSGTPGNWVFPNTTGTDIYYFNNVIGVCDGVRIDLQECTLNCTMTGSTADNQCGFVTAQRDFELKNGSVTMDYTYTAGTNNGNILMFGGRGGDVALFPPVYDSLLTQLMGNIRVSNVRFNLTSTAANSRCIFMLGGLMGVDFDTLYMEGNATAYQPMYYEFGWATNESEGSARQTSHMNNFNARNIRCNNFTGGGFDGNGAYNVIIDGLWVNGCPSASSWGSGESRFYRPWNFKDLAGAKHGIYIKNLSCNAPTGTAITIQGDSATISGGYLGIAWVHSTAYSVVGTVRFNSPNLYVLTVAGTSAGSGGPTGTGTGIVDGGCTWDYVNKQASTDFLDCELENIAVLNAGGYGIRLNGATQANVRNITMTGCQRGLVTDTDTTQLSLDGFKIRDSTSFGIQIGLTSTGIYSTARKHVGSIRNGFIAGSAASAAISVDFIKALTIENVRFGYETAHDDVSETTQLQAVSVGTNGNNVIVRNCYVAGVASGNAFNLSASVDSRGCRLERIQGLQTTTGLWLTDFESSSAQALSNSSAIVTAGLYSVRVTAAGAVTGVILNAGSWPGQEIFVVHQSAAGNTITFAASGTSNVADGVGDVIAGLTSRKFVWDSVTALWYPVK